MTRNENLYGTRIVQIPPPEFIVFYNGKDELPDRMERKISDMYAVRDPHAGLELKAVMLNIAGKHNQKLKEACRTLRNMLFTRIRFGGMWKRWNLRMQWSVQFRSVSRKAC